MSNPSEPIKSFRQLNIWQKGIEIVQDIYHLTKTFPKDELYGLTSQMRRAAVSIPANIAEGFARRNNKEYRQFLYITLGSAAELETQIDIAQKLSFLNQERHIQLVGIIDHLRRMVLNLIKKL